jgi:tetratricopeptide (TPR) repeat protein
VGVPFFTARAHDLRTHTRRLMEKASRPCGNCGLEGTQWRCLCKGESYCGQECQKAAWKAHKPTCTTFLSHELEGLCREHGGDALVVRRASIALGGMFCVRGQFEAAEECYQKAVHSCQIMNDTGDLAMVFRYLGDLYQKQDRYTDAHTKFQDSLCLRDDDAATADCLKGLASVYSALGQYDLAIEGKESALAIYRGICGSNPHTEVAGLLSNIGGIYTHIGMLDKAVDKYTEALGIFRSLPDRRDGDVASTLINLAGVFVKQDRLEEAFGNLEEALPVLRRVYGEKSIEAATALFLLGDVYSEQGKFDESLKVHNRALRYRRRALPGKHPDVISSIYHIASIHMGRGELHTALGEIECLSF